MTATATKKKVSIARKISHKTMGFTKPKVRAALEGKKDGENVHLYTIMGIANRSESGEGQYGPWTKFGGDFIAFKPGEQNNPIRSPWAFFPQPFDGMLETAITSNPGVNQQFVVHIFAIKDDSEKSNTGYTWGIEQAVSLKEDDSLTKLLEAATAPPTGNVESTGDAGNDDDEDDDNDKRENVRVRSGSKK